MADAVASWLRQAGLDVELDPVHAGRPNVVARLRGNNARRRLIWEGHLDTVQVSGMAVPPFAPANLMSAARESGGQEYFGHGPRHRSKAWDDQSLV